MPNWISLCFSATALSAVASTGTWSADIRFVDAIQNVSDGGILVEAGPGDVLVFDGGVFDAGGRPLSIFADAIRIEETTLILSHAFDSVPSAREGQAQAGSGGRDGKRWGCRNETIRFPTIGEVAIRICNLEGEAGSTGSTGTVGRNGEAGADIELAFKEMTGVASLVIVGNGQKGGRGQQGGQGGPGGQGANGQNRAGDIFCNRQHRRLNGSTGGSGGPGGVGGQGGEGGRGSSIIVDAPASVNTAAVEASAAEAVYSLISVILNGTYPEEDAPSVRVMSVGGRGGDGGAKGVPGVAGKGGDAGRGSHCGGGGDPGRPGGGGSEGAVGKAGSFGPPGVVNELQEPIRDIYHQNICEIDVAIHIAYTDASGTWAEAGPFHIPANETVRLHRMDNPLRTQNKIVFVGVEPDQEFPDGSPAMEWTSPPLPDYEFMDQALFSRFTEMHPIEMTLTSDGWVNRFGSCVAQW